MFVDDYSDLLIFYMNDTSTECRPFGVVSADSEIQVSVVSLLAPKANQQEYTKEELINKIYSKVQKGNILDSELDQGFCVMCMYPWPFEDRLSIE